MVGNDIYTFMPSDYDKYVKISAVSFDGGWTWVEDFPVTIPKDIPYNSMWIRLSYRLSTDDEWTDVESNYPVSDSRIMVLNTRTSGNNITSDQILNSPATQYAKEGTLLPLLSLQQSYLGKDDLTELFPGWTENGEQVPWYYEATIGRHILLPAEGVPLDTSLYKVQTMLYFTDADMNVYQNGKAPINSDMAYLQTLTSYKGETTLNEEYIDHIDTLTVPEYVQAVQFPNLPGLNVDTVELSSTVLYMDTTGIKSFMDDPYAYDRGLQVEKAYKVAADNPCYTAIDGLLYNKEETAIMGVPTGWTELTVPAGVTSVTIPYQSKLTNLVFEGTDVEDLPEVNYAQLKRSCLISVPDELLDDYLIDQSAQLQTNRLHVAAVDDPSHSYIIQDDLAMTDSGVVHLFLGSGAHWVSLPDSATGLEANSLRSVAGLQTLMLPQNGEVITFEDGCFNGTDTLQTIGCYSKAQYDAAKAAAPEGVEVILMGESQNGYTFMRNGDEVLLLGVPDGLTTFDGTIPLEDGTTLAVTTIGDGVFKDYADLVWVDLSKSTTAIGYQAFQNCYNLQGVIINAPDTITISEDAFDGCNSLRFIASNAAYGDVEDWDLALTPTEDRDVHFLYCPTGATGYNSNWTYFTADSDIARYELLQCGGTRVLYGVDAESRPTLALRAGSTVDGAVDLPDSTSIIYKFAFQNTREASGGYFAVNWQDLYALFQVSNYAFSTSAVGGDITLPLDIHLMDYAFAGCGGLTSVALPGDSVVLDKSVFVSCPSLTSATLGGLRNDISGIFDGTFNGCTNLRDITFTSTAAPRLLLYSKGIDYMFDRETWESPDVEVANLKIHVPEGSELYYVDSWRYGMLGYASYNGDTAYQDMYDDVYWDLYMQYFEEPTADEVRAEVDRRLLTSENRVRTMLGLPLVDAIEHDYDYVISDDGMITLTAARGITATDLSGETLEMPDGYYLDYIGSYAFMESPDLRMVELPYGLAGIYHHAFSGVTFKANDPSDGLIMVYDYWSEVPKLFLEYEGEPFSFGIDDSRIALMDLYGEGSRDAEFIQAWTLPMTGYSSVANLRAAVRNKLSENGAEPTDEEVEAEVTQRLMKGENRVRKMLFSSSEIKDPKDMIFVDPASTQTSVAALDSYSVATPETAALPAETDDTDTTEDTTETPVEEVPAEEEPDADAADNAEPADDADAPPDDIATPETAQAG